LAEFLYPFQYFSGQIKPQDDAARSSDERRYPAGGNFFSESCIQSAVWFVPFVLAKRTRVAPRRIRKESACRAEKYGL
jgi:hypothetical protein